MLVCGNRSMAAVVCKMWSCRRWSPEWQVKKERRKNTLDRKYQYFKRKNTLERNINISRNEVMADTNTKKF